MSANSAVNQFNEGLPAKPNVFASFGLEDCVSHKVTSKNKKRKSVCVQIKTFSDKGKVKII